MSLQGSLDTFALPDVLVLLSSTHKSGELHVAGSRSATIARQPDTEGRLWFDAGGLVGADVAHTTDPADAVFELLRLTQGTFSFLAGTPSGGGPRVEIEGILGEAQARLVEWREIEAVVPSLDAWLQLSPEPPMAHVSMRGDQWRLVVAVGAGCPVGGAIAHLGLEELSGCRAVKELVEAGLVSVTASSAPGLPAFWSPAAEVPLGALDEPQDDLEIVFHGGDGRLGDPGPEPAYGMLEDRYDHAVLPPPVDAWADDAADVGADFHADLRPDLEVGVAADPWAIDEHQTPDPSDTAIERVAVGRASAPAVAPAAPAAPASVPDWRTELGDIPDLDSLASLPTRRRHAEIDGVDEAGPRLGPVGSTLEDTDDLEDGEEPLNRGLLLKFLSSVRN